MTYDSLSSLIYRFHLKNINDMQRLVSFLLRGPLEGESNEASPREPLHAPPQEAAEETGWKLVHGDVFRKPRLGVFGWKRGTERASVSLSVRFF